MAIDVREDTKKDAAEPQKEPGWKDLTICGVITEPGTAKDYITGGWRALRPVWDSAKCINCLICWVYCPDSSVMVEDSKVVGIDYDHCKGCGICAEECPPKVKAYTMVPESEFRGK
jgi:2-oxoacid:acceptor oxidoreductase delta subunit (pyruvate/2-ketoisovalerate family)